MTTPLQGKIAVVAGATGGYTNKFNPKGGEQNAQSNLRRCQQSG
jgi:hypothetical protein